MDSVKTKQQWSQEETKCFVALWASAEIQGKLDGVCRSKPIFEILQREMAAAGYERSLQQLINKLKKLKKDYRDQKNLLGRSGSGRPRPNPVFDVMDSVLGDRAANQNTGALNSSDINTTLNSVEAEPMVVNDPDMSALDDFRDTSVACSSPVRCSSPISSTSSASASASSIASSASASSIASSATSQQQRHGKRKRDSVTDMLQYLQRSDDRYHQQMEKDNDTSAAILESIQRLDAHSTTIVSLMDRMVAVMESQKK